MDDRALFVKPDIEVDDRFSFAPYVIISYLEDYDDICLRLEKVLGKPAKPMVMRECESYEDALQWFYYIKYKMIPIGFE